MTKKPNRDVTKPYEPTPRERATVKTSFAKQEEKTPAPRVKIEIEEGLLNIRPDHPMPSVGIRLLMEVTGTTDPTFLRGLLYQLADAATTSGETNESDVNFMLSVVKGVEPRDQVEAMLAAQMAVVHMRTMSFGHKLANAEYLAQQDSAERGFNKLARTYTTQIEAFKRYRTGGEQKVTVEHVTVNAGGQAIVGNVAHGGRGDMEKSDANPTHRLAAARAAPRCTARAKRTRLPCRAPAVRGWCVCRMHGARGGASRGVGHGNYRHGGRTKESVEARKMVNALVRLVRETIE